MKESQRKNSARGAEFGLTKDAHDIPSLANLVYHRLITVLQSRLLVVENSLRRLVHNICGVYQKLDVL